MTYTDKIDESNLSDKLKLEKLFYQEEQKAEKLINKGYLFFVLPSILVLSIILFLSTLASGNDNLNNSFNLIGTLILLIYHFVIFIRLSHNKYNKYLKYISIFFNISAITFLLFGYSISNGWVHSLRTASVCTYFMVIALSGLYHNPKIPIYAGILSALQYTALFFYAFLSDNIQFGPSENFYLPTFSLDVLLLYNFVLLITGSVVGYISYRFRQTLERSINSEAFSQAMKELDTQKTYFFSNVSHELRTPLTLLLAPLETMLNEELSDVPERLVKNLNVMYSNALRLLKLINNLLDFAKMESGKMTVNKQKTDIIKVLEYYMSTISAAAESRKISLEMKKDGIKELNVQVDRGLFEKAVFNLLSNALKFTPNGGSITLGVTNDIDTFSVYVKDSGIGIPADKLNFIFERFSQVDSSMTKKYDGTGIGLSLTQDIVKLHDGTIIVESKLYEGSKFIITIPMGDISDDTLVDDLRPVRLSTISDMFDSKENGDQKTEEFDSSKKAILVVEDNHDMREFVASILVKSFNVIKAMNGRAALKNIRQYKPDLVISDVMMPEMNGYELASAMKADPDLQNTPIILLTAKAETSMRLEGLEHGADDYLLKPFNPKELILRVTNMLKNRELQGELAKKQRETDIDFSQAAKVQKTILTSYSTYKKIKSLEIAVRYLPMNGSISGDYYHIEQVNNEQISIFLSDAAGHGIHAALTTMQIDLLNKDYIEKKNPDERLALINRRFTTDLESRNFFSAFLALISSNSIQYSSAAHPAQYLIRPATKELIPLKPKGSLIGVQEDISFEMNEIPFLKGDILLLFTDGTFEEFNQKLEEWGEERLIEFLKKQIQNIANVSMDEFVDSILKEIKDFTKNSLFDDDITLIAVQKK